MSISKTYIYLLQDPRNGEVFYVGKTNRPLARVYAGYNQSVKDRLKEIGEKVRATVVEEIVAKGEELVWEDWGPREIYWIAYYKEQGAKLLNTGLGGDGPTIQSEAHKKALSLARKGVPRSEETKKKISLAKIGKPLSEEHKKALSLARKTSSKRKIVSPHGSIEHRRKMSESLGKLWAAKRSETGKSFSVEHQQNLSEAAKKAWAIRKA